VRIFDPIKNPQKSTKIDTKISMPVKSFIEKDNRFPFDDLEAETMLSRGTLFNILYNRLIDSHHRAYIPYCTIKVGQKFCPA